MTQLKPKELNDMYNLVQKMEALMGKVWKIEHKAKFKSMNNYNKGISTLLSRLEDGIVRASSAYEGRRTGKSR